MIRTFSRVNGWSLPPHPLQILAWIVVLYLTLMIFALIVPSFESLIVRIVLYVILGVVILISVIINVVVTTVDPADDSVKEKVKRGPRPAFDRHTHRHVIDENYYCNICETSIHPSSKHCRQCNKCVLDFDHHCKWLNNCVGAKNYKIFLIYIVVTTVCLFLITAVTVTIFALRFARPDLVYMSNDNLTIFGAEISNGLWIGLVVVTIIIAFVIFALTLHLMIFHLRLIAKGLTTYNFIMQQKRDTEQQDTDPNNVKDNQTSYSTPNGLFVEQNAAPPTPLSSDSNSGSIFAKLKFCLKRKQQRQQHQIQQIPQENRIQPERQMSAKFMQVSQKQKIQIQRNENDRLTMDDVSSNTNIQSQTFENQIPPNDEPSSISNQIQIRQSTISSLPPFDLHEHVYRTPLKQKSPRLPSLNARGTSTDSKVPYEQVVAEDPQIYAKNPPITNDDYFPVARISTSSVPVLPPLPITNKPINLTSTKIYEPTVESVFLTDSSKELTLPSITLYPPDTENHQTEEIMNEIPASAFSHSYSDSYLTHGYESEYKDGSQNNVVSARVNFAPSVAEPGLYYASGQFTVAYRRNPANPNIATTNHVTVSRPSIWYKTEQSSADKTGLNGSFNTERFSDNILPTKRVRFDSRTSF